MKEQNKLLDNQNTDESNIEILTPLPYISKNILREYEKEPINEKISSGNSFHKEEKHLELIVGRIRNEIRFTEYSIIGKGAYETIKAGDATDFSQLKWTKSHDKPLREKARILEQLSNIPYQYRVDIIKDGDIQTYYISTANNAVLSEFLRYNVLSAYSPQGESLLHYSQKNVELRRSFEIKQSILLSYTNQLINKERNINDNNLLSDPYLIQLLESRRALHSITDILVTIQQKQRDIVNEITDNSMIVQGCAGSGKTMILFHRIARILNYLNVFAYDNVLLITPNEYYKSYMKQISVNLSLQEVQQETIETYYQNILGEFIPQVRSHKIQKESNVSPRFLMYVYSNQFIEDLQRQYNNKCIPKVNAIRQIVIKIAEDMNLNREEYLKRTDYELISNAERDGEFFSERLSQRKLQIIDNIERLDRDIKSISKDKQRKIDLLKRDLINEHIKIKTAMSNYQNPDDFNIPYMKTYLSSDLQKQSNESLILWLYRLKNYFALAEQITNFDNRMEQIEDINSKIREKQDQIKNYKSKLTETTLKKQIDKLQELSNVTYYSLFIDAFNSIGRVKEMHLNNRIFKFTLYAMIIFLKISGLSLRTKYKFICIDEGQDLSFNEYRLLKELNDGEFNIFGDVKQNMRETTGINDWSKIQELFSADTYVLNENYRNTNQIIEFCNRHYGADMVPIGLNGENVKIIESKDIANFLNAISIKEGERWAIIISKKIKKGNFLKSFPSTKIDDKISVNQIGNGIFSILYPDEVKGIEFESVLLYVADLSNSELYVSATRALQRLIIVRNKTIISRNEKNKRSV